MDNKLYVGNLSYGATEEDLRSAFAAAGTVNSATIIKDRETGRSKGFGFVEMSSGEEANKAVELLNGKELARRAMNVSIARPREERPRGFGGGDRGGFGGGRDRGPRRY